MIHAIGTYVATPLGFGVIKGYVGQGGAESESADEIDPLHIVKQLNLRDRRKTGDKEFRGSRLSASCVGAFLPVKVKVLRALWKDTLRIHDDVPIPPTKAELVSGLAAFFDEYAGMDPEKALAEAAEFGGEKMSIHEVRRAWAED